MSEALHLGRCVWSLTSPFGLLPQRVSSMAAANSFASRAARPYDIIVWGASGYTGRLIARYLAQHAAANNVKFAIAARSESKLAALASSLSSSPSAPIQTLTASLSSPASLTALTAQCRALIAAAGPFALHGEPIIAACISTSTDYCDITGEVKWVRQMIDRYSQAAERAGVLLLPFCGVDSVPSEIVALFAMQTLQRYAPSAAVGSLRTFVKVKGGISGGTVATILQSMQEGGGASAMRESHTLALPEFAAEQKRLGVKSPMQLLPRWSADAPGLTAPYLMAAVNTQVVRRALSFFHRDSSKSSSSASRYARATYSESMVTSASALLSVPYSLVFTLMLGLFFVLSRFSPTRSLLQRFVLPAPGQGPSDEERRHQHFSYTCHARPAGWEDAAPRAAPVVVRLDGEDPYGETAKLSAEIAMLLVGDGRAGMLQTLGQAGGFGSVSHLMGDALIARLQQTGRNKLTVVHAAHVPTEPKMS